ncbi:MAG: hypothetical protein HQL70_07805 [Magnetococcales bacterium]|nr:hypothetical protein [Magnetococcales bacterium]
MKILGIDPAPGKESTIFDGEYHLCKAGELNNRLTALHGQDVLIAWDAPLTGSQNPDFDIFEDGDHTQRLIEKFFSRQEYGFKPPNGISVLGYAGCSHWTISRRLLGLPRVGRWDTAIDELPFLVLASNATTPKKGSYIVEVHPALAIWVFCKDHKPDIISWEYKKSKNTQQTIWNCFCGAYGDDISQTIGIDIMKLSPKNDDELDALFAWLLASLFIKRTQWDKCSSGVDIQLLGNLKTGSFLLPVTNELRKQFNEAVDEGKLTKSIKSRR